MMHKNTVFGRLRVGARQQNGNQSNKYQFTIRNGPSCNYRQSKHCTERQLGSYPIKDQTGPLASSTGRRSRVVPEILSTHVGGVTKADGSHRVGFSVERNETCLLS